MSICVTFLCLLLGAEEMWQLRIKISIEALRLAFWGISQKIQRYMAYYAEKSSEECLLNVKFNPILSAQWNRIVLISWWAVTDSCPREVLTRVLDNFFETDSENVRLPTSSCLLPIRKFPSNRLIPDTPWWFSCSFKCSANIELWIKKYYSFACTTFLAFKSILVVLEIVYCAFL